MGATPDPALLTERQARARLARLTRTVYSVDRRLDDLTRRRVELNRALVAARQNYEAVRDRKRREGAS
jgi:hypothetical protein